MLRWPHLNRDAIPCAVIFSPAIFTSKLTVSVMNKGSLDLFLYSLLHVEA